MLRTDFSFDLPQELIAQQPLAERSASRLLLLDGDSGARRDLQFRDLPNLLRPNDLLVCNDTRVIPARIFGHKSSGGRIEILLERVLTPRTALVHARASKGLRAGAQVELADGCQARMLARDGELFVLEFSCDALQYFVSHGEVPLPPYMDRPAAATDLVRYQTVYADRLGAVAAPTAGLHFDAPSFAAIEARGVQRAFVTLHVGAGTFAPVRSDKLSDHRMHAEYLEVGAAACEAVVKARAAGGRVIAVGTTVVRSLETAAAGGSRMAPFAGDTRIFITPGYQFRAVDALITNFHLPESTLLMLCAAFAGKQALLDAYAHAIAARYRFFSYGDAMFILPAAHARGSR